MNFHRAEKKLRKGSMISGNGTEKLFNTKSEILGLESLSSYDIINRHFCVFFLTYKTPLVLVMKSRKYNLGVFLRSYPMLFFTHKL